MQLLIFSFSIDLIFSQIVWCFHIDIFLPWMHLKESLLSSSFFNLHPSLLSSTLPLSMWRRLRLNQNVLFLIHQFMLENERVGPRIRNIQYYERIHGYTYIDLIGSYNNIVFKQRFRMTKQTFNYVCQQVGPLLIKVDTNRRRAISVETRGAIAITRLTYYFLLYIIADSFRVGVSYVHGIVIVFCQALK